MGYLESFLAVWSQGQELDTLVLGCYLECQQELVSSRKCLVQEAFIMEFQELEVLGVRGQVFHWDIPSKLLNCQVAMDSHTALASFLMDTVRAALVLGLELVENLGTPQGQVLGHRLRH